METRFAATRAVLTRIKRTRPVAWVLASEKRRVAATVLLAVALFSVTFALLGRAARFGRIANAAGAGNPWWFPLCLAGELLAYAGYVLAYRDVARADGGVALSLRTIMQVVVLGFGATFLGASAGGLAMDYWALRHAGAGRHESTRRVLAMNTLEWSILAAAAAIAGVLLLAGVGRGAPRAMTLSWPLAVAACVGAAVWVSQPGRVERLTKQPSYAPGGSLVERASHALRAAFADAIGGVALVRYLFAHPVRYAGAVSGFAVYWLGDLLTLYAALRAFGVHPPPAALVVAYASAYIATAIPLPAGGAGGIDATLALLLAAVGLPFAGAVLGVLVYRGFSYWLPIVPAAALLPALGHLRDEIDEAHRSARDEDSGRPRAPDAQVSTASAEE